MAITLQCKCGKKLQVGDDKAGKKARCPGCQTILQIPALNSGDDEEERVEKAGLVTKPKRRPARDDDDDEEEERPRSRKAAREDDDDDADEAPRSRKKPAREDDDEDDQPRPRKKVQRDDDDEDDAPRPKKKAKKGSKKTLVVLALVAGGVGLFCLLGLGAGALWWFDLLPFGGGLGSQEKYLPDGCKSIHSTRVAKIRSSSLYKELEKELSAAEKKGTGTADKLGLSEDDIERETIATAKDGTVTIITTKKSITGESISKKGSSSKSYKETSVGNYKMYEPEGGGNVFAVPESKIYIEGPKDLVQSILKRDKKPQLPSGMEKAMSLVSFSACEASAQDTSTRDAGGDKDVDAISSETDFSSNIVTKKIFLCKNSETADDKKKEAEVNHKKLMKELEKDKENIFPKVTFSKSGSKMIETSTISGEDFKKMLKKRKGS